MSSAIEADIRQLYIESGDPLAVASQLAKRWDAGVLSDDDVRSLTRFMIHTGLLPHLFNHIRRQLKKDARIPWSALVEALARVDAALQPLELDAIFEGVESQSKTYQTDLLTNDLAESTGLDRFDSRPREARARRKENAKRQHEEKRADLMRRLEYARVNRLITQERRILEEIQAFDPNDPALRREKDLFEFREAQEIVANALAQSPPKSELERKFSRLTPETREAARPIVKQARAMAKTANEQELYDLALMLIFMELYGEAVAILESRRLSERIDWMILETMILGRQFAAALGEVENLEVKYAGQPEAPFALTYARARALWGLGDTVTAIELMRSLVKVRPSYRSASTLLQQWIEEAP
jgi:hypothetical protein